MNKNPVIYLNNRWVPLKSARISPMDHGFLYGDGVFETLRSYEGHPFKLDEHLKRLSDSCRCLSLTLPKSPQTIRAIVYKTLACNKLKEGTIRITCTRGEGAIGLDPAFCPKPTFVVMALPYIPPPSSFYLNGISIGIVKTVRTPPEVIPNRIKSSNFLNNILAKIEAKKSGAHEGILLNNKGFITEGTVSNLFYVQNGILVTPSAESGILEGITRNTVIDIAKSSGIRVTEKLIKPKDLLKSEECFITNTGYEIMPVTKIDRKKAGTGKPGRLTLQLMSLFKTEVQRFLRLNSHSPRL
ncbi:MAG: aminotransferase class IV [Nitrospiria bacterium]